MRGRFAFHMMCFDFLVHQAFDLERIHVAADHQEAQIIRDEFDNVMLREHVRVLSKDRALEGIVDIEFEGERAFLARLGEPDVSRPIRSMYILGSVGMTRNVALMVLTLLPRMNAPVPAPPIIRISTGCMGAPR